MLLNYFTILALQEVLALKAFWARARLHDAVVHRRMLHQRMAQEEGALRAGPPAAAAGPNHHRLAVLANKVGGAHQRAGAGGLQHLPVIHGAVLQRKGAPRFGRFQVQAHGACCAAFAALPGVHRELVVVASEREAAVVACGAWHLHRAAMVSGRMLHLDGGDVHAAGHLLHTWWALQRQALDAPCFLVCPVDLASRVHGHTIRHAHARLAHQDLGVAAIEICADQTTFIVFGAASKIAGLLKVGHVQLPGFGIDGHAEGVHDRPAHVQRLHAVSIQLRALRAGVAHVGPIDHVAPRVQGHVDWRSQAGHHRLLEA
mmetsp:Transcript_35490/g.81915  ORF Transcript_35490/g.81915 Transcript_35490/m.81915 type:complete len:316 (-) Transcript_35490:536-1483(-)